MAVITKSDIAEINNDLSNIKSELSEKLFLHEKEQDEKIEQLVYKLQNLSACFDYELEAVSERTNNILELHKNLEQDSHSYFNDTRELEIVVEQLKKEIKFIKYVTAFLAIVSVIALLK